jgi:predicted protein tyrosine phosphatase
MKLLFICNANLQRSPTAERIFKDKYETKSAGINPAARIVLSKASLDWADVVFVMEDWMRTEIANVFPREYLKKKIISLDIPDKYNYMEAELISLLKAKVKGYLDG